MPNGNFVLRCSHNSWPHLVLESLRRCAVEDQGLRLTITSRLPAAPAAAGPSTATAPGVASGPGAAAPSAPPASVAVPSPRVTAPAGLGISVTLDNVGNAGVVEASVEETGAVHVEAAVGVEAASVHGGVGVDAAVDGPQAAVEEELGVSLSLTLPASTPSACAPGASAPGASAPARSASPGAAAPTGLSGGNSQEAEKLCKRVIIQKYGCKFNY